METLGDRLSFVREEQSLKAELPIAITESEIVMAVREEHP
jgi:hypothetical protein